EQLSQLQPRWHQKIEDLKKKAHETIGEVNTKTLSLRPTVIELAESPFEPDIAEANGSSVATLIEFEGKSILLGADAFSSVLEKSLRRLLSMTTNEKLRLDAFKISHHGSDANTSIDLLRMLDCSNYLISTNGRRHGHPHDVAVARILQHGGEV